MNLTPRHKLAAAALLLAVLPLAASLQGASAATVARWLLGLVAVGGLVAWYVRARGAGPSAFKAAPRLKVVQRVGLSQRSGLVLVEVDGRAYLVVHGDGFARVRPTRRPAVVKPAPTADPKPTLTLVEP